MFFQTCVVVSVFVCVVFSVSVSPQVRVPSSCNNLPDGLHYIQPSDDGFVIPVVCDDGFAIIDLSLNKLKISSYFSSITEYWSIDNKYSIIGSDCEISSESSSWLDWWIPSSNDINTKFRISTDCMSCDDSISYKDNTAYYMTNHFFCWNSQKSNQCKNYDINNGENEYVDDLSYNLNDLTTSLCNVCDDDYKTDTHGVWTDCYALELPADTTTDSSHDSCLNTNKLIVKPSITDGGEFCTCYKPSTEDNYYTYSYKDHNDLYDSILPKVAKKRYKILEDAGMYIQPLVEFEEDDIYGHPGSEPFDCSTNKIYLGQDDFLDGTYRITECGTYVLKEDIVLNFESPESKYLQDKEWSPNNWDYDDLPWYPKMKSAYANDVHKHYEDVGSMHGTYSSGFFAGITIESDDVIIDLSGHEISMDYVYYIQQRFFTVISLANKPFIEDQGKGNFGRQPFTCNKNIVIKNGIIGRSSHHGIHGNGASNLQIRNVKIKHFDVAGLQCNGCSDVLVKDAVVGPQNSDIPVLGRYAHGRALIPRLKHLAENYGDERVTFNQDRTVSIQHLVDEFVDQMDMIYNHIHHKIDYSQIEQDKEQWEKAKKLFLNPTGLQDGGSSYGIIFGGIGSQIAQFGNHIEGTSNIELNNVEIHGIQNSPIEKYWAAYGSGRQFQGFFFDTLDWENIISTDEDTLYHYQGDAYHDLVFAAAKIADNDEFCLLSTVNTNHLKHWTIKNDISKLDNIHYGCGSDIQSQDAKGVMGLRADGVKGLKLTNVHIHDIQNHGTLGSTNPYFCSGYDTITYLKDSHQSIEPGYTGTRAHGMILSYTDVTKLISIKIENIQSFYGTAIGASAYQGTILGKMENIDIRKIQAGILMDDEDVSNLKSPNEIPRGCSFEIGETDDRKHYPILLKDNLIDEKSIIGKNVFGYDICDKGERIGSMKIAQDIIEDDDDGVNSDDDSDIDNDEDNDDNIEDNLSISVKFMNSVKNFKNKWQTPVVVIALVASVIGLLAMVIYGGMKKTEGELNVLNGINGIKDETSALLDPAEEENEKYIAL